ncbi:MAG: hypothetical protein BWY66_00282 [bacterium ADurb.Bin374]|nr:MAG: hypothetical protein BWY66_00282 [bacterium ADurb.Bin374]
MFTRPEAMLSPFSFKISRPWFWIVGIWLSMPNFERGLHCIVAEAMTIEFTSGCRTRTVKLAVGISKLPASTVYDAL